MFKILRAFGASTSNDLDFVVSAFKIFMVRKEWGGAYIVLKKLNLELIPNHGAWQRQGFQTLPIGLCNTQQRLTGMKF